MIVHSCYCITVVATDHHIIYSLLRAHILSNVHSKYPSPVTVQKVSFARAEVPVPVYPTAVLTGKLIPYLCLYVRAEREPRLLDLVH